MRDELLSHYERELIFLRRMGAEFARKYPKIAARLLLDEEKVEDPHVERLIEAFAFLAGRISLKLDDDLPEITESFLNVLYPHYLAPIPSMAIAQFNYGSPTDKLTTIQKVERGTRLSSRPVDGTPCRFRSCYQTELVPIELQDAALESAAPADARGVWADAQIRLSFRCFGDANLHELKTGDTQEPIKKLRFYLNGDPQLVYPLYELIFNGAVSVELRPKEAPIGSMTSIMSKSILNMKPAAPVFLPPDSIKQVGFEDDEGMLPFTARSFSGYRLLTEYFAFPYKFLFFDVMGFDQAVQNKFGSHFDILINLKEVTPPRAAVTKDTFRLGCTPIVNLFNQTSDPIYLSQKKYEYQVIPDVHRQSVTEVYSVDAVTTADPRTGKSREFQTFYSLKHAYGEQHEKVFWYATRKQSQRPEDNGSEIFLSLVDMNFNPRDPAVEVLNIKTTCTNRDLPAKLPFGGKNDDFEVEGAALLSKVRCLTKPTETIRLPLRRATQWRLISHLNLNYLSLTESVNGVPEALQEILQLYNYADSSATRKQILGITGIETRRVVRQIGQRIGAGFVRGVETTLEFDEEQFVGAGTFLFACVLERFLGLYASLNSFNQLVVKTKQREGIVKRFPPRAGEQVLL
ncbi:MAG TPA: type VI secretion system baseplate subunit TssF [Pyrinomonadaceae bacterium]|nr:type VI secretion system baseplate subunit TssF [Pyrinomonadaceae bacterium]